MVMHRKKLSTVRRDSQARNGSEEVPMGKWMVILAAVLLPLAVSAQETEGPLAVSVGTDAAAAPRMTKWLVFDLDMAYHSNYEDYTGPDGIPAKRLVKWIGAGIAIAINYDLMQCSNIWMVERSELLKNFQDLYMIRYNLDPDSAQGEAKLDLVSLDVNYAKDLNRAFNADYMIVGSFDKPSVEEVSVKLRVLEADEPFTEVAVFERTGLYEQLPALCRELSHDIMNEFGLNERPGTESYWAEPITNNLDAFQWLGRAISAGHSGKMISFFDEAMSIDPDFYITLVEYAKVLYFEKNFEQAFELLDKATALKPGVQLGWLRRGNAYFFAASQIDQNIEYLNDPDKAPEGWTLGSEDYIKFSTDPALVEEYFDNALVNYEKSVEVDPGFVSGWVSVAETYERLAGLYTKRAGESADPAAVADYTSRAQTYSDQALATWNHILEVTDLSDRAYQKVALSMWEKDNAKALQYFLRSVQINPRSQVSVINGAILADGLKDLAALKVFVDAYFSWADETNKYWDRFVDYSM
jgi:tetratricopeptide (TPR) repeat protein